MAEVLLIGMGPTTLTALDSLMAKFNVVGLIRGGIGNSQAVDPVISRARQSGVPVYSETSPSAVERLVSELKPDCVVVSSYNRIINARLLSLCPFVNVHYAPLPQYRGRANVNWALINDESCAAITIHTIVSELDAGNILFQRLIPIRDDHTVADLYEELNEIQREQLADTVAAFLNGDKGVPQRHHAATYGCTRIPSDGEIYWPATTRKTYCLVRALASPYPGAYTFFNGRQLTVWKAQPIENAAKFTGRIPGRVVGISKSDGTVDVLTGDGILRVIEIQPQGQERCPATDVIQSLGHTLGMRLVELLSRIQQLEEEVKKLMESQKGNRKYAE